MKMKCDQCGLMVILPYSEYDKPIFICYICKEKSRMKINKPDYEDYVKDLQKKYNSNNRKEVVERKIELVFHVEKKVLGKDLQYYVQSAKNWRKASIIVME